MSDPDAAEIMKARFVGVLDANKKMLDRQISVEIGEDSELILQFGDTDMFASFLDIAETRSIFQKEYVSFEERIKILNDKELKNCLKCASDDMINLLSSTVTCVGCRRAVETLFQLVSEMEYRTLYPIKLLKCDQHKTPCEFTLEKDFLKSSKKLFMLLYVCKPQMEYVSNVIPKIKKNKRCNLHCLDSHKVKSIGVWMEFWKSLNRECRDELVTINIDAFVEALESYLQKHRFCQECKAKVERAYKLLLKDVKPDENDQEYDEVIFRGIKVCKIDRHLHIDCGDETISGLINRAEPELTNSRRERHAKTMDVAQEEVLTCLGIILHEKLHKLCQKMKAEEQTWVILLNICLECMKRRLVSAIEEKRGYTNMDLFLLEHEEETKKKEMKKEIKREKKRKKKLARKTMPEPNDPCNFSPSKDELFRYNEEDDEDEEEEDEEEEEEEEEKESHTHSQMPIEERRHLSNRQVSSDATQRRSSVELIEFFEETNSDWQIVENHCKQCNSRKVKPRSHCGGDGQSSQHSSPRSTNQKTPVISNDTDRHINNAQGSREVVSSKKKSKSSSDVTVSLSADVSCCRGATARFPLKTERNSQPTSNHRNNNNRLQKHQVFPVVSISNNNSKLPHCNRLVSPVVSSNIKFSSSTTLPPTNSAPTTCHQSPDKSSSSSTESSCNHDESQSSAPSRTRRCNKHKRSPQRNETLLCCQHACGMHQPTALSDPERSSSQRLRKYDHSQNSDSCLITTIIDQCCPNDCCAPCNPDEPEKDDDFLTEQERVFFKDNWEQIKEKRDKLRSKLRQAWNNKSKAVS